MNEKLKAVIKEREKVIKQLQNACCEGEELEERNPLHRGNRRGKFVFATMQSDANNSQDTGEIAIIDDSLKMDDKMVVRTQDVDYSWKSFEDIENGGKANSNKESRKVSVMGTAKFVNHGGESDSERQRNKRAEVLRDEIVTLDEEIGELHQHIGYTS